MLVSDLIELLEIMDGDASVLISDMSGSDNLETENIRDDGDVVHIGTDIGY